MEVGALKEVVDYDPKTGLMTWRPRPLKFFTCDASMRRWNTRWAGRPALRCIDTHGYYHGNCMGERVVAHRAAYAIFHGDWPEGDIDHINGVRTDNRIENLRDVSRQTNLQNVETRRDNTSGVVGVSWYKQKSRWQAYINHPEIGRVHLGNFVNLKDAVRARRDAEVRCGYHENHGRKKSR